MRSGRQVRVMMLGWEYPPRFAGGLGKACRGLSLAMSRAGCEVFFVLPTFPERLSEPHLNVTGAREFLVAEGWTESEILREQRIYASTMGAVRMEASAGGIHVLRTDAQLYPYGIPPEGEAPEIIRKFLTGEDGGGSSSENLTREELQQIREVQRKRFEKVYERNTQQASSAPKAESKEIYGKNIWSEIERFCFAVRQMAQVYEVDVVHAHDWMTFPAAFEFQKVQPVPVFLQVHATEYDRAGENGHSEVFRIEREGFRRATHIFAVSKYTGGIIERLYGVHKRKISIVYNAPDEEIKGEPAIEPQFLEKRARAHQIVFLGRLTFQKGPDHFLKAAALVARAQPDAKFIICGTGDMFDQLRAQANELGIEDRVHFTGFVDPQGVDQILKSSRLLVMPSVSEPFGLVALEAIHCGIPVILSKQSGVREVLHRALHVDFWDHERLADQMVAALRLPDLSKQLVAEGMEQVRSLSWEKSARKVVDVYKRYLGNTYAQMVRGAHGH